MRRSDCRMYSWVISRTTLGCCLDEPACRPAGHRLFHVVFSGNRMSGTANRGGAPHAREARVGGDVHYLCSKASAGRPSSQVLLLCQVGRPFFVSCAARLEDRFLTAIS
jgi:hypothetical protein